MTKKIRTKDLSDEELIEETEESIKEVERLFFL